MFVRCSISSSDILAAKHQNTQRAVSATKKDTAIHQQEHSCETLICQRHQTLLMFLFNDASGSTRWRVRELTCPTSYSYTSVSSSQSALKN